VALAEATLGSIASYYSATASLEAEKQAEILARVQGVITAREAEEGDRVNRGAVLLRIDEAEYELRLSQAAATLKSQEGRFTRAQELREKDLMSTEEFEAARSEYESAKAAAELAALELSYCRVEAPFRGYVTRRLVDPGQNVSVGTPLFQLADFDPLLARVHVPSKEFRKLSVDQPVQLRLDSDGTRLEGRIKLVSPVIDTQTGTIKVTVEVSDYPEGTRPGDFAEVLIETERHDDTVIVPKVAVVNEKGEKVVYVASADSTAERRPVEVGFEDELRAEILSGIEAGEPVVVRGQRSLKHGSPLQILEDTLPGGQTSASASETE
jgi:RND family efflux transporter MFP subunit